MCECVFMMVRQYINMFVVIKESIGKYVVVVSGEI